MDIRRISLIIAAIVVSAVSSASATDSIINSRGLSLVSEQGERINFARDQLQTQFPQFSPIEMNSPYSKESTSGGLFVEVYREVVFGANIGGSGIVTHDIDGDGRMEMAMGGGAGFGGTYYWYIVKFDGHENYTITWNSPSYESIIADIEKITIDGVIHFATFHADGTIRMFDASSLEEVNSLTVPNTGSSYGRRTLLTADIDNDGEVELVAQSPSGIHIFSLPDFAFEQTISEYADSDIVVANVDNDAALEIVVANGYVLELNDDVLTVQWDYSFLGFGAVVSVGDIDSDGTLEIIGADAWYRLTTFDADIQSPKWQINSDLNIDALFVSDINGDGIPEVLYGDGQWGAIYAHDGATGALLWSINNPEHGVTNISVADFDGDGELEVVWGAGASSSGQDNLYVHDISTGVNEWTSTDLSGPFEPLAVGDADNDGRDELIYSSFESNSGYDGPVLKVVDAKTLELEWESTPEMLSLAWGGGRDLVIADVNNDGLNEIVMATSRTYDGRIVVIDLEIGGIREDYLYGQYSQFLQIAVADVDGDDSNEIIVGTGDSYVLKINGENGDIEWNSIFLGGGGVSSLELADIDDDSAIEIIVANQLLYVFDGLTGQQWQSIDSDYTAVTVLQDNDGSYPRIIAGTESGEINSRTIADLHNSTIVTSSDGAIDSLAAIVSDNSGIGTSIAYSSQDAVSIYNIESETLLWESGPLGSNVGANDSLKMTATDKGIAMVIGRQSGVLFLQSDTDADSYADNFDNCIDAHNDTQTDSDGDGIGNACDGDIYEPNDCLVNFVDAEVFKRSYLASEGAHNWNEAADLNSDGTVNLLDYSILIQMIMQGEPGSSGLDNACN